MGKGAAIGNGGKRVLDEDDDDDDEKRFFLPSVSWRGAKPGYYFGTTHELGTGYYLDSTVSTSSDQQQTQLSNISEQPNKKAKRSVAFADDRNETAVIVASSAGQALLAQAEQRLLQQGTIRGAGSKIVALTVAGVQAAASALQKVAEQNALQRAKEDSSSAGLAAEHYMESEIALYENIAAFKAFAADPAKLYPVLIEQQVVSQLVQLLLHDNVDIAIAVVSVLLEWLDTDLIQEQPDEDDADADNRRRAVHQMVQALLSEGTELLVENLARMQQSSGGTEEEEEDEVGRGVDDVLSLFENLLELDDSFLPSSSTDSNESLAKTSTDNLNSSNGKSITVAANLCRETALVAWLLEQVDNGGSSDPTLRNRCMELLAYLAPREEIHAIIVDWSQIPVYHSTFTISDSKSSKTKKAPTLDGIEILLQSVAAFRKKQPADETEVEFLENAAMVLASCLTYSPPAVEAFLNAQGIQLVMRCLKERVYAGAVLLQWLDFTGPRHINSIYRRACEEVVQAGALKHIFPLFLGRNLPKYYTKKVDTSHQKEEKKEFYRKLEAAVIRILYALVRHLRDDSPYDAKERLLAKFLSDNDNADNSNNNNDKVNRLVELLLVYDHRSRQAEYRFYRSDAEEALLASAATDKDVDKDAVIPLAALNAKLAAGGDVLHRLAAIAAFCCAGSGKCHRQILAQLHARESGIGLIREVLEEFVSILDVSEQKQQLQAYLEQI